MATTPSMPPIGHRRILASAGSGKTFRLSARYIELLRREPDADPAGILASTFTRAAAAEIRDRVLLRLARAVADPAARRQLAEGTPLPAPDGLEALALLRRAARRIDRLRIRTLDSFFASAVSAFSVELGLPAKPTIPDEAEESRLRDEAIERMLARGDEERLLASIAALRRGRPTLSIGREIWTAIADAVELARDSDAEAWSWAAPPPPTAETIASLAEALAAVEVPASADRRLRAAIDRAASAMRTLAPDDIEGWEALITSGAMNAAAAGSYYGKAVPDELIRICERIRDAGRSAAWSEAARRTRATCELATAFLAAFDEVKREAGVVTFADLARILGDAALRPDLDELALRLDARVRHVLLDEFQDTSVVQWRALLPVLRELAAGDPAERSIFLVGDLKQSIYGWRGASPSLLEHAPELLLEAGTLPMEDEHLATSYRSSPVVLEAVDAVFDSIETSSALAAPEQATLRAAARAWSAAYLPHRAASADRPGVVELHIAPVGPSGERSAPMLDTTTDLVCDLVADGVERIGVLCRTNAAVAAILHRLRLRAIPAEATGVGSLQDAAPVNALLDALVLADHPDHTIAAFHVARSPLGAVLGLTRNAHRDAALRARVAAALRHELDSRGYAATLRRLGDAVVGAVDRREAERIAQLVAAAARFDRGSVEASLRPAFVVDSLRALALDERGGAAVTVMNIHQSKGLEFDATVLCDLDAPFRRHAPFVAMRRDPQSRYERVLRWIPECLRPPELEAPHDAAIEERFREHLSLLYVALTRARHGLFAVIAQPSAGGGSPSFARLLRDAWAPSATTPGVCLVGGSRTALGRAASPARTAQRSVPSVSTTVSIGPPSGLRVERATSASRVATGGRGDAAARDRGRALHAMLELVGWYDEGLPSAESFRAAGRAAAPRLDAATLAALADSLPALLAAPEIRSALSRPAVGPPPELRREFRFARLRREAEATRLEEGIVDRLHLIGPRGAPTAALVIDFKSDRDLDPATACERYGPQLDAYRSAVAERFSLPLEAVGAALLLLGCGRAVRWPG
jgi:ATP-dependent exoDNAse (exonuclease V) beta subunit